MIDPRDVPDVAPNELLARYVLYSKHFRASDRTVRQDAFVPHPYVDLSVTRHLLATESELSEVGRNIASVQAKKFYGRADILAKTCLGLALDVKPDPVNGNPNHANVLQWPTDKPAQKMIAMQLAATAQLRLIEEFGQS